MNSLFEVLGYAEKVAPKKVALRLSLVTKPDTPNSGHGYNGRPAGQGLTWFQWCSLTGVSTDPQSGPAWDAYCRGLKPRQWKKEAQNA